MFIFALTLPLPTHIGGGYHYNSDSWEIIYYTLRTNIVLCFQINLPQEQCTSQFPRDIMFTTLQPAVLHLNGFFL